MGKEKINNSFNIKEIIKNLNLYCDYIDDIEDWINNYCDNLTKSEISKHRTEITAEIYNHNREVINSDLGYFVETIIKDENNWSNWKPTKEQLIEAINKYYD